jgi:uncharacterized protein
MGRDNMLATHRAVRPAARGAPGPSSNRQHARQRPMPCHRSFDVSMLNKTLAACAAGALLAGITTLGALAQDGSQPMPQTTSPTPQTTSQPKARPAKASAQKTTPKPTAAKPTHKLAIQMSENNPQAMNLALNNARNVVEYYQAKGEQVAIEVVTYGPGIHMLREDTSPVKQRIATMALENPSIGFIACANTQANMSRQENKPITFISEAKIVPSGVIRLMELQDKGYAYIRP